MMTRIETVDAYIEAQPEAARGILNELRVAILSAAPGIAESIRYDIPSYKLNGRALISFGAWKRHIGLYPVHELSDDLEREVAPLRAAKSTVQLPLNKPFPGELIERIMTVVVERNARLVNAGA